MVYPYIHLSLSTKSLPKQSTLNSSSKEWLENGFYLELEHVSSLDDNDSFSPKNIDFVIFIGVRIDNEALPSTIGKLFKMWINEPKLCFFHT